MQVALRKCQGYNSLRHNFKLIWSNLLPWVQGHENWLHVDDLGTSLWHPMLCPTTYLPMLRHHASPAPSAISAWTYPVLLSMDFKKVICHTTGVIRRLEGIHRPCVNISKKPCTLAVVWGLVVDVAVWLCWLGTGKTAEFGLDGDFVETRVVEGGVDLDRLLNREGDCDRLDRCNLLEDPGGEGRGGIAGVVDTGFPEFVFLVVVSVPMEIWIGCKEVWRGWNVNIKMGKDRIGFHHQPFLSSFLLSSFCFSFVCFSFVCILGCSSGIEILLKWTVRFCGGAYLFFKSSSKLIRLGPFFPSRVSYRTYWCSSASSDKPVKW